MEFNNVTRGAKRAVNETDALYAVLDAGFLCHIACQAEGKTIQIPTAYGRKGDQLFIHGSTKNRLMNHLLNGQEICLSVTHLDGIVLARSMFDASVNYRSAVIFGTATLLVDEQERLEGLKVITDQIIPGRWDEVPVGSESELKATMVMRINMTSASVKIRNEGPAGDDEMPEETWSGHIPLVQKALSPVADPKNKHPHPVTPSVAAFIKKNG